jgi:hypothetical protein
MPFYPDWHPYEKEVNKLSAPQRMSALNCTDQTYSPANEGDFVLFEVSTIFRIN